MLGIGLFISAFVDSANSSDCKISFEELCSKSNTITLTWGTFKGHGTNENNERAVIDNFPSAIGIASKYGFKAVSNGDEIVILQK